MTVVTKEQREAQLKDRKDFVSEIGHQEDRREDAMKRVRWTRELVLKGTGIREPVDFPAVDKPVNPEDEDQETAFLIIRPLTDGEFVDVQRTILGDISTKSLEKEMKASDLVEREQQGKYLAVSIALSIDGEEWTPEDIGLLPAGFPDTIYNRLAEISGFPRPTKPPSPNKEE